MTLRELRSGSSLWVADGERMVTYSALAGRIIADVVIIGAGITGALVARELTRAGLAVAVLDQRDVACGSTAASTAILQYELDTPLWQLEEWCPPEQARAFYRASLASLRTLAALCDEQPDTGGYQARPSLYFASTPEDVPDLQREYRARCEADLPVEYWGAAAVTAACDFAAPAALWSPAGGQIDPYRFTQAIFADIAEAGCRVFVRSPVESYEADASGVRFRTKDGEVIARRAVIAAGYESETFLPQPVASFRSTFAFASRPLDDFPGWPEQCLIWESARPYLYLRTTADGRMIAGGEDTWFRSERVRDRLLPGRVVRLEARVRELFPRLSFETDFAWAGTFAETPDGLPFIGIHPDRPGLLFALCYGGNGIACAVLAATMVRDHLEGRDHPLSDLVAFNRSSLSAAKSTRITMARHRS